MIPYLDTSATPSAAAAAAALGMVLYAAHQVADHWIQTEHQAATKGRPGWPGRGACAAHVLTYTATTAAAVVLGWWLLHLPLTMTGYVLGQAVSAVTHYWADRRTTLATLARWTGHTRLLLLGAPRPGHDDNPTLGTGAYALDQSWHVAWLTIAALVTTFA